MLKKVDLYIYKDINNRQSLLHSSFVTHEYDVLTLYTQVKWKTAWLLSAKC